MSNYVETQTAINQRRMDEIAQQQQEAAAAAQISANSNVTEITETQPPTAVA